MDPSPQQLTTAIASHKAGQYLRDPAKAARLVDDALRKANRMDRHPLREVWDSLMALLRMIRAYTSRRYSQVPWTSMLYATGAVIYFVMPLDMIPDFIAGLGLADDALVIGWVVRCIKSDLDAFREWEASHTPASAEP